ncbi:FMN-binding protein [Arthrobacter woluwensis]|uniref:FMN-binding protein n=1 Tax=Arthrobacter woluwensis TaxID=156980 RepID=UPI001AAEB655|nr:FMN-binding protein [Arthrobacter woluwensis]QTF71508.1 FMN-binding protein [Arthrobacter woluwensis]
MRARAAWAGALSAAAILIGSWSVSKSPASHAIVSVAGSVTPSTGAQASADPEPSGGTGGDSGTGSASGGSAPTSAATSAAKKASGTYTGSVISTRYGNVQVQVVLAQGKITDVIALQLTDQDGRSQQISSMAAPILRQEVLAAQSASVDSVSGATYTSEGYLQSLQAALDQAQ